MLRPLILLLAVAAAVTVGPAPAQAAPRRADSTPLVITIESLTPSVVPKRGPLTITGTITNTSGDQWRAINIYPLASSTPITTAEELAAAAKTDPDEVVGDRFSPFVTLDVLDPGQTSTYFLRIPRDALPIGAEPGVYWLGVHALGETDDGRDDPADGKARTFIPSLGPDLGRAREPVDVSLVASIRRQVAHEADGRIADPDGWAADLAPGGRLDQLTRFAAAAGSRPLTWVVDPAVTDAVARLADGNPPRTLGSGRTPDDETPPDDKADKSGAGASARSFAAETAPGRSAKDWLAATAAALDGDRILALPYGDLDVAAAAEHAPGLYHAARRRSGRSITALDLPASPVVAPPSGYLDDTAIDMLPPRGKVLVSNDMVDSEAAVVRTLGHKLVVARTEAASGGPGPGPRKGPVDVRQRILSEAALRLLERRGPLVVSFPPDWDPRLTAQQAQDFFTGLDVPWLRLTSLNDIGSRPATAVNARDLTYPPGEQAREVPPSTFAVARELMSQGRLLDAVLPENDRLGRQVTLEALPVVSYAAREDVGGAADAAASTAWIRAQLAKITVEPPHSFTLLSDTGRLSATVVNGLDQPVRVRVMARTDDDTLEVDSSPVLELGPQERQSQLLEARSSLLGVHQVDLVIADAKGRPVGNPASFPLRAAQVSNAIWVVIATGAGLLFTAIGIRLFRRIRRSRAERRATRRTGHQAAG